MNAGSSYVLLLLDGEAPSKRLLRALPPDRGYVAATDGAARTARTLGLELDLIIGDLDSIDVATRDYYSSAQIVEIADQYSNDFEKALRYLIVNDLSARIIILGMEGKRADHMLTNWSVLVRMLDECGDVRVIDEEQEHYILTDKNRSSHISGAPGSIVSLTPIPHAVGVSTLGLRYPIDGRDMLFGREEGLSNVVEGDHGAHVRIDAGALMISIPFLSKR